MKISSKTAILTLASLAASNVTEKVNAAIVNDTNEIKTANNSVVISSGKEASPQVDNISIPESTDVQQFSQNLPRLQSDIDNNSKIISEIQNQEFSKSNDKINSTALVSSSPQSDNNTPQFSGSARGVTPRSLSKLSLSLSREKNKNAKSVSASGESLERSFQDIAKIGRAHV